ATTSRYPSSADRPSPPSFPTRRSSDLARDPRRRGRSRGLFLMPELREAGGFECLLSGEELIEHQAERVDVAANRGALAGEKAFRSEEHTSELQSLTNIVCRLLP